MRDGSVKIDRQGLVFWLGISAVSLGVYLVFGLFLPQLRYHKLEAEAKQNLHAVQLGLERMAVDDPGSNYPYDIYDVIRRGYLNEFPANPFLRRPMRGISIDLPPRGEHGWLSPDSLPAVAPGDFIYVRRYSEGFIPGQAASGLPVVGYTLVLY